MQNKRGVSLIVLVITVIVMVILAGTIILTINNTGIMGKAQSAVDQTNLKEVQTLAELKWSEAFLDGNTSQESLEKEVLARMQEEEIDLSKYIITVTDEGVEVAARVILTVVPDEWKENVVAMVDGVPIPKGFVASSATGEREKNGGLVIYEGTEAVTDANIETARRTRNQYVWVPVPKEDFTTKFVRQAFRNDETILLNTIFDGYPAEGEAYLTEVDIDLTTNMPLNSVEAKAMYSSVKEYEGFYVARYEAGIDTQRKSDSDKLATSVYVTMGKIPYNHVDFSQTLNIARNIYPTSNTNYGVVSTLMYGVQWDRTLNWWLEVGAKNGLGNVVTSVTDSLGYGNYEDVAMSAGALNNESKYAIYSSGLGSYQTVTSSSLKNSGTSWALTTGALKAASVNNIYDMAGNMREWTMEYETTNYFEGNVGRGSSFGHGEFGAESGGAAARISCGDDGVESGWSQGFVSLGFRPCLYIKR